MRCAIIGAGALGRRHLESLVRSPIDMDIDVVDPVPASRDAAAGHVADMKREGAGTIAYHGAVSAISNPIDFAVLSTNARERLGTLKAVLEKGVRNIVLEKVLFCRLGEYEVADRLLAESGAKAWVNCARRANPRARELRSWLRGPIHYKVSGKGWGLGCNVVHHLDELSYFAASPIQTIDIAGLDPGSIPARRDGYREFTGTLKARTERGDTFEAICDEGEAGDRLVTITDGDSTFAVSQFAQDIQISTSNGTRREPYPMAFQSEATARHVVDIVAGRAPALPEWRDAAHTHRLMIAAFLDHLRKTQSMTDPDDCPIT